MKIELSIFDWDKFISRLDVLNKKASKYGLEKIVYHVTGDIEEKDKFTGKMICVGKEIEIEYNTVIAIGDFELIAVIDLREKLINVVPEKMLPVQYRTFSNSCDHCGYDRNRLAVYVLKNLISGGYVQIGYNCLAEYLGIDPSIALRQFDLTEELIEDCEEKDRLCGMRSSFTLETFLSLVCCAIRQKGYVSNSAVKEGNQRYSTAAIVWENLISSSKSDIDRLKKERIYLEERTKETAEEDRLLSAAVYEWLKGLEGRNNLSDYLFNLMNIAQTGFVSYKSSGYAASMVSSYMREEDRRQIDRLKREEESKQKGLTASEWIGAEGDKVSGIWRLVNSFGTENTFSYHAETVYYHHFSDLDGNHLVWHTAAVLNIGKSYKGKGTIKKLEEFRGEKQTVLTRCKLEEIETKETAAVTSAS